MNGLPGSTLPIKRSRTTPLRVAYPVSLILAAVLLTAGQVLSFASGFFREGRRNVDPSFIVTRLDLCCLLLWLMALAGLVLIFVLTRRAPRIVAGILLATCLFAITPLQCEFRQMPLARYETGFLQWTSTNVHPAALAAWQATLPPVTTPTIVPPAAWPPAVASLNPSNVIQNPGGIILEWGMLGTWGNSRRVFIAANGTVPPPANDENVLFNWKTLGAGFFAAYQATG